MSAGEWMHLRVPTTPKTLPCCDSPPSKPPAEPAEQRKRLNPSDTFSEAPLAHSFPPDTSFPDTIPFLSAPPSFPQRRHPPDQSKRLLPAAERKAKSPPLCTHSVSRPSRPPDRPSPPTPQLRPTPQLALSPSPLIDLSLPIRPRSLLPRAAPLPLSPPLLTYSSTPTPPHLLPEPPPAPASMTSTTPILLTLSLPSSSSSSSLLHLLYLQNTHLS